jgi:hypothetical protein
MEKEKDIRVQNGVVESGQCPWHEHSLNKLEILLIGGKLFQVFGGIQACQDHGHILKP